MSSIRAFSTYLNNQAATSAPKAKADREQSKGAPAGPEPAAAKAPATAPTDKDSEVLERRRRDLKKARAAWVAAKNKAEADLELVKSGARMAYLADPQQYPKIDQGCKAIDSILDALDDTLHKMLDQYVATPANDQAKLSTLAASAAETVERYEKHVAENALIKAIDKKEFADVTIRAPLLNALDNLRKALA